MVPSSRITLTSARSRFFTAARFPKQKLDSSRQKDEDSSDLTFVLSISASVEKRVKLDEYESKSIVNKDAHWPSVPDSYDLVDIIGVGSYTLVYSAFCRMREEPCAVKIFDLNKWNQSALDDLLKEVVQMSILSHDNITTYYSTFVDKEELWLVMKNMENGSLLDIIRRKQRTDSCKHGVFEEVVIATIMSGVVKGLTFLHDHGYIHKDIKAENILIGEDGSVKIADFCIVNCISKLRSYIGSFCWLAPEIIKVEDHKYTPKADVWSLGITAIETATGSPPYHKSSTMKVLLMISLNEPPTLETDAETRDQYMKYGKAFRSFISDCLKKDPSNRPPVKDLLFHPFFKKAKDQKFLQNVFASIPFNLEPRYVLPKKAEEEPVQKERKEWVLTHSEMLTDSVSPEHEVAPESEHEPGEKNKRQSSAISHVRSVHGQDDKSSRSFWSYGSRDRKRSFIGQTHQITLKIRGLHLDTPMVLKTGIHNNRELFDIAFSYDTSRDKPESIVENLVREGLIDPKDRHPIITNLKKLLDTSSKTDGLPSITFGLNSEISSDETPCEWNLVGYATLILKSTEANMSLSPSFTASKAS